MKSPLDDDDFDQPSLFPPLPIPDLKSVDVVMTWVAGRVVVSYSAQVFDSSHAGWAEAFEAVFHPCNTNLGTVRIHG